MMKYLSVFIDNGYDSVKLLPALEQSDLVMLNINDPLEQRRILSAVAELGDAAATPARSAATSAPTVKHASEGGPPSSRVGSTGTSSNSTTAVSASGGGGRAGGGSLFDDDGLFDF
jgi:hypothetical protein